MDDSERGLGHLFGVLGGVLIGIGGLVAAISGVAHQFLGQPFAYEVAALTEAILLFVVAGLVLLFTHRGSIAGQARGLSSGILLVILAVIGWGVLGLAGNVLGLVGALFAFLAGLLYLIEPTRRAAHAVLASS